MWMRCTFSMGFQVRSDFLEEPLRCMTPWNWPGKLIHLSGWIHGPCHYLRYAFTELVQEQFQKGNLFPSSSPWNFSMFVIKKQTAKWHLLQDLHKINSVMEDMGALQPDLPSPTMIPRDWHLTVIDPKDCFFDIPLHPDDAPQFAFSIPSTTMQAPLQRYHWVVLPQGMKNGLTIFHWFVARVFSPIRQKMTDVLLYHYMDNNLVAAERQEVIEEALALVVAAVTQAGLLYTSLGVCFLEKQRETLTTYFS